MKFKTKLIISFWIITFVPIILSAATILGVGTIGLKTIEQNYGFADTGSINLTNSVQLLDQSTVVDFEKLCVMAETHPEQFSDKNVLEDINGKLGEKESYLVVRKADEIFYNGSTGNEAITDRLPEYGVTDSESGIGTFVDSKKQVLIKQVDFLYADGSKGSAFIITSTRGVVPEVKKLLLELLLLVIAILIFTATLLILWIYRSMITPIRQLQEAADNIKEGNLDFSIEVKGHDELGELAESFEAMRKRLKDNAEEKLSDEKESRALISNIAHDLKTPITAVKGYAEGIIDGVANTPEKVDKYVRTIYNKANEMDTLINELTLYSKIDTNRIPYNFAKINVSKYFQDCMEEIGLDLESKGIGIAYYNYVDPDVVIIADPEQLRRVINNIISNSVKYMNKTKGFINFRIKDVGDFIQVEIEDNGRGIAQRDLPYIFDRFYRADASRNSATGGSGIGLSIVKKIIEDHGGKIWATSKEDNGTTMYFVIRKYEEVYNEQDIDSGR